MLEEAERRDHRRLGRQMDLFHMQEEAPGQVFWHPNGWTMYVALQDYMRRRQREGGYVEINTPQVVARSLWERSGHWEKYREHMFVVEVEEEHAREKAVNALKPMNCPCHVQVFNQGLKSYRDLPLRMAEFGSCSRYEPSGAMHGIMRVRGFTQDDAHIFCTESQIEPECARFIGFLARVYADLGFESFDIKLSTRPEKRIGSDESWDFVEGALKRAIESTGNPFEIDPGEGAFYGPKLDFFLTDAIGRQWQCGTFQVDPNLPERLECRLHRRGRGQAPALHAPPRLHRLVRALPRHPHRGARRPDALLARAPPGGRGHHRLGGRSLRPRGRGGARGGGGAGRGGPAGTRRSTTRSASTRWGSCPRSSPWARARSRSARVTLRRLGEKGTEALPLRAAVERLAAEATPPDLRPASAPVREPAEAVT